MFWRRIFNWLWLLPPPVSQELLPPRPVLPAGQNYIDETDSGRLFIEMRDHCPECRLSPPKYMKGPSGGLSTNIFCARCGEGLNVTPMVGIAEFIGRQQEYIQPEYQNSSNKYWRHKEETS